MMAARAILRRQPDGLAMVAALKISWLSYGAEIRDALPRALLPTTSVLYPYVVVRLKRRGRQPEWEVNRVVRGLGQVQASA